MVATGSVNFIEWAFGFGAIIIGFCSVYILLRLNQKLGGKIGVALRYFILGVGANIFAVLWSLFFDHLFVIAGLTFNAHQLFMTFGMIFFILSTYRFSLLVR